METDLTKMGEVSLPLMDGTTPQDGCIILKEGGESSARYITRYRVNRSQQRKSNIKELVHETFYPCVGSSSCLGFFIKLIESEPFLVSLHFIVILLGVIKAFIHTEDLHETLHIVHAWLEVIAALLQVVIRIHVVRKQYRELKPTDKELEYHEKGKSVRGKHMAVWVNAHTALNVLMFIIAMSAFIVFHVMRKLSWTLLSNNFVMVVAMVTSTLTVDRLNTMKLKVKEDQHKVIIYETQLLLSEALMASSGQEKDRIRDIVATYNKCLNATPLFSCPSYIHGPREGQPQSVSKLQQESDDKVV